MNSYKVCAVILAAGSGKRMQSDLTKQRMTVLGKTVLKRTLEAFEESDAICGIVVVSRADELEFAVAEAAGISKLISVVAGGACRAESAANGFYAVPEEFDFVAVHDAARCLISPSDIDRVVSYAYKFGAATAASSVTDTVKKCDFEGNILQTVDRVGLYTVSTPQVFSVDSYKKALAIADISESITDDNMLMEMAGIPVRVVELESANLKITRPADVELAEYIIFKRENNR